MADKKRDLRKTFLETFVHQLIVNSLVGPIKNQIVKETTQPFFISNENYRPSMIKPRIQVERVKPIPKFHSPIMVPQRQPSQIRNEDFDLGKITQFLRDPSVLSVECPGPGKNIHVNRSGTIQTTPLVLSKEEINNIMDEVSSNTRIPVTSGLFRAIMNEFLVTAVISEFVGTRFIIQKRIPGMV